jgi:hypothetical protein
MRLLTDFYTQKLYPLQDGVLKIVKNLQIPFYLTGGTALSRYYLKHRFSDDLDFFVNNDPNFADYVKTFVDAFKNRSDFLTLDLTKTISNPSFFRTAILKDGIELKIDMVNDIDIYFGEIIDSIELGRVDNLRNILSNKLSAIYRFEIKDFVDIWQIAKNLSFSWETILDEARQKELGLDGLEISNAFLTFPFDRLQMINWIIPIDRNKIEKDFKTIAKDLSHGEGNSLYSQ